jgi:hypothetical protein
VALGTAAAGTATAAARGDHVHPTDGVVLNALVNAKGDIVTATADDTPAVLTVGSNGQVLMADSAATAGLRYVDPPANRNLLINGAMQAAQRSTSVTGITGGGYRTADRFYVQVASGIAGTWTNSVEADAPTGSGFRKSMKLLCTTAKTPLDAGSQMTVYQVLEGQDLQRLGKGTSSAQQITASFWVKSNVTGTYVFELYDNDNTRHIAASYTISAADTWEKKTITLAGDTTGAFDNDNAASLYAFWWLAAGTNSSSGTLAASWQSVTNANRAVGQTNLAAATNNYWQVTGVQLETGPVATPFEFEPYEATLRKCQRYYQRMGEVSSGFPILQAYLNAASDYSHPMTFLTTLRTAPSSTVNGAWATNNCATPTIGFVTKEGFALRTAVTGAGGFTVHPDSTDDWIAFDAEL